MPFFSYSQNFEDVLLWRALQHIERGTYVDIGAQDPISDSVSKAFYEQGWRGLHVEPTTYYAELLRRDRPDEVVIQSAVSSRSGTLKFFEFPGTGLSTADRDIAATHQKNGFPVVEVIVPAMTLDQVFDAVGESEINWLKIDVEGWEASVLKGWRRSNARPWIIVIEAIVPLTRTETYSSWEPELFSKGYSFAYFDGLNRYYLSDAHNDLGQYFRYGPSIWDGFQLPEISRAVQAVSTRHQEIEDHLRSKLQKSATEVKETKARLDAVHGNFEKITRDLTFTHGTLSEVRAERDKHLLESATLRVDKIQLEAELSRLKADLSYVHGVLNETRRNLDVVDGDLKKSQEELREARRELVRSKEEIGLAEGLAHQERANAAELRNQLDQSLANVAEISEEARQVGANLSSARILLTAKCEELALRTDELAAAKVELEKVRRLLEETQGELVAKKDELGIQLSQLKASSDELEQAQANVDRLQRHLNSAELQLYHAQLESEGIQQQALDQVERVALLQEALDELSQTRSELDRASDALSDERKRYNLGTAELEKLKEELVRVRGQQDRLRSEKSSIEAELSEYRHYLEPHGNVHGDKVELANGKRRGRDLTLQSVLKPHMLPNRVDWHAKTLGMSLAMQVGRKREEHNPEIEASIDKISIKLDEIGVFPGDNDQTRLLSPQISARYLPDYVHWMRPLVWRMHVPKVENGTQRLARQEIERALSALGHRIVPPTDTQLDAIAVTCGDSSEVDWEASPILLASDWHDLNFPIESVDLANERLAAIACSSTMGVRCAVDRGVAVPCIAAGLGIDHLDRIEVDPNFGVRANPFRFLHVSTCEPDTGVDALLECYGNAFSSDDKVSLVIVSLAGRIPPSIGKLISELQSTNSHFPDVQLIERELSVAELKALYVQCHVFVAPSRSEGFGYPIATAFMCGLPVVATAWGGHLDYCDESNSWLVDFRFERAKGLQLSNWNDIAWANPWPSHLLQALKQASQATPDERVKRAWWGRRRLLEKFTWRDVAMRVAAFANRQKNGQRG